MSEPDYPYSKKPLDPAEGQTGAPPPMPHPEPPSRPSPPFSGPKKFTCQTCGKTFTTKEDLSMHMQTVHMSPKEESIKIDYRAPVRFF